MPFNMNEDTDGLNYLFNSDTITVPELIDVIKTVCKGALDNGSTPFEIKGAFLYVLDLAMFYAQMDKDFEN